MLLDDKERARFAAYCEQCADSANKISAEYENPSSQLSDPLMEEMAKREKQKAVAFLIVAAALRNGESVTVD